MEEIGETEMGIDRNPVAQNTQAPRANLFGRFDPLCSSYEAAAFLGVHPKTLHRRWRAMDLCPRIASGPFGDFGFQNWTSGSALRYIQFATRAAR